MILILKINTKLELLVYVPDMLLRTLHICTYMYISLFNFQHKPRELLESMLYKRKLPTKIQKPNTYYILANIHLLWKLFSIEYHFGCWHPLSDRVYSSPSSTSNLTSR